MPLSVSILNVLMSDLRDWLEQELKTLIEGTVAGDDAKAGLIKVGKLKDDPTVYAINVMVYPGDEEWPHILNTQDEGPGMFGPTYEIGGGQIQFWRRRFVVEFEMFFEGEYDQLVASNKANVVLSRAQHALFTFPIPQTTDDFGEHAHMVQCDKTYVREGGGEGDYIWRGRMNIEFFTSVEP